MKDTTTLKQFLTELRDLQLKYKINLTVCEDRRTVQLMAESESQDVGEVELGDYWEIRGIEGGGIYLDEVMLNEAISKL